MFRIEIDWGIPGSSINDDLERDDREHAHVIAGMVMVVIAIVAGIIYHNGAAGASVLCYVAAGLIVLINAGRGEGDIVIIPAILAIIGGMLGAPISTMFVP